MLRHVRRQHHIYHHLANLSTNENKKTNDKPLLNPTKKAQKLRRHKGGVLVEWAAVEVSSMEAVVVEAREAVAKHAMLYMRDA